MTNTDARHQLAFAISHSGLTMQEYAATVLLRSRQTVWRWLRGRTPIPQSVKDFLLKGP